MTARIRVVAWLAVLLVSEASAQTPPHDLGKIPPLTLRTRIPLPGVYGRMDHFGWDNKRGVLIVSALGNSTVEIVDQWRRTQTITGLEHPQASLYIPGVDKIVVSSQSGKLRFYDAGNYALMKTLDFGAGANTDNMRYDPETKLMYVGYGERQRGALAMVNPTTMERVQEYRLGSHPEVLSIGKGRAEDFCKPS